MARKLVGSKQSVLTDTKVRIGAHAHDPPILLRRRPTTQNIKPQRFVSLHHHSTFSYLDGYQLPDAHVRRCTELNMGAMAMTEHGNIDSHTQFERAAVTQGVRPIFGCEIYMPATPQLSGNTQSKFHLTVIARNAEGYHNLISLVTESWHKDNFYFDPTVSMELLIKRKRGLIVLSGCQGGLLFCSTVGGKTISTEDASYRRGLKVAKWFQRTFGEWYYLEVQAFPELEKSCQFNPLAAKMSREIGAPLVGTMDCHYTMLEESEVQQILHNLRPGQKRTLEEQARDWGYTAPLCPPPNDRSIYRRLRATGLSKSEAIEAVVSTEEIAQECDVELPKMEMVRFPLNNGKSTIEYWREKLREGWRFRKFDQLPPGERSRAKKQLIFERDLIESKDFVDYFLLVQAGVVHIKDKGIPVGPGRGSAAASLVSYLLRITEINPLNFSMMRFERFIDVTREDLPDIDLDFPGSARPELRKFYEGLLGEGCVNNVGTFTYFRSKNSLDDVARVYRVPQWEVERVKNYLIERTNIDLRASSTIEDTVAQFPAAADVFERYPDLHKSSLLEGGIKGFGVHAAAIILSNGPITTVTSMAEREVPKGSGNIIQVVGLDRNDAEYRGLLKMDYLGLNTMSMIEDCVSHPDVNMTLNDLYTMPLDDPKVYDAFKRNDVVGIFQFDGRATRYVNGAVQPENFQELMDITSLSRPGALHGGSTRAYIEVKQGVAKPESIHPALDSITAPTKYQIIFQEQILFILRDIGDFPWGAVAEIRRIISKKKGEAEFNKKREQFMRGAAKVHERLDVPEMSEEIADTIWRRMITAGAYAFNVPHAASYSMISYHTQWFKQNYAHVFYYGALKNLSEDKAKELLRDAHEHEIRILPPSVKRSGATWAASRGRVRAGFMQVPGIGKKRAQDVLDARTPRWRTWRDLIEVKGIGKKGIENIVEFAGKDDPFEVYKLERDIKRVTDALRRGELGELPLPTHTSAAVPDEQGKQVDVVWLGQVQRRNFRDLFEYHMSKFGTELDPTAVKDPELREWAVLFGEDGTDRVLIKIDRWRYPKFKDAIAGMDIDKELILVKGFKPRYSGTRQINVHNLYVIDPE